MNQQINEGNVQFKVKSNELVHSVMLRAEFSPDRQLPMYSYFNDEGHYERGVNIEEKGNYFLEVAYVKSGEFSETIQIIGN